MPQNLRAKSRIPPVTDDRIRTTPGWLVAFALGATLLGLAIVWAVIPWPGAAMATLVALLAFGAGKNTARWYDDGERGR